MRKQFDINLNAEQLFNKFIFAWIAIIAGVIIYYFFVIAGAVLGAKLGYATTFIMLAIGMLFLYAGMYGGMFWYMFHQLKMMTESTTVGGVGFTASYDIAGWNKLIIKGVLLTIITFGIYFPWFDTELRKYILSNTQRDGKPLSFDGTAMGLFNIMVLGYILPVAVLVVLLIALMKIFPVYIFIYLLGFLVVACAFIFFYCRWMLRISWNGKKLSLNAAAAGSTGYIMGQLTLTFITLGIYYPFAILNMYKYFVNRIEIIEEGKVTGRFVYNRTLPNEGWVFFLQFILVAITMYIYLPWAVANVSKMLFNGTYIETIEE